MKMKVKIFCFVALVLLLVPFAVADMNINVRTYSDHLVSISVLDPGYVYSLLDSYHLTSDVKGEVTATYTGSKSEVKLLVKVSKGGEKVLLENFDGDSFSTSEDLYLLIRLDEINLDYRELDAAEAVAVTEAAEANEPGNSTEDSGEVTIEESVVEGESIGLGSITKGVSGLVSGVKGLFARGFYIVILVIVGIGALFFVARRFMGRRHVGSIVKGIVNSSHAEHLSYGERIERAEEKLEEAQKEFEGLKKHSKIAAAERKLEEDKKNLEKLKEED